MPGSYHFRSCKTWTLSGLSRRATHVREDSFGLGSGIERGTNCLEVACRCPDKVPDN